MNANGILKRRSSADNFVNDTSVGFILLCLLVNDTAAYEQVYKVRVVEPAENHQKVGFPPCWKVLSSYSLQERRIEALEREIESLHEEVANLTVRWIRPLFKNPSNSILDITVLWGRVASNCQGCGVSALQRQITLRGSDFPSRGPEPTIDKETFFSSS